MPTIIVLFDIQIVIHPKEHNPPHVHAFYKGDEALFNILNGEMFRGEIPNKQVKIVKKFISTYRDNLLGEWKRITEHD